MHGPSQEFRAKVMGEIKERRLGEAGTDDEQTAAVISLISDEISGDVGVGDLEGQSPEDILAAVDAWAALLSDTMGRSVAPGSALAGWDADPLKRLRVAVNEFQVPLRSAATAFGASGWGVGIGFPAGVSVSVSWSIK